MGKAVAKIISYILNPLLMPTIGVVIIFIFIMPAMHLPYEIPTHARRIVYILVFITTFVVPITMLPFMLTLNIIKNIQLETARERVVPLLSTGIAYLFAYFILVKISNSASYATRSILYLIQTFILGTCISVFLCMLVSLRWKISAHMIGIGGIVGTIVGLSITKDIDLHRILVISFIVSGLLGTSRLKVNAHVPTQVYAGFFLGYTVLFTSFILANHFHTLL